MELSFNFELVFFFFVVWYVIGIILGLLLQAISNNLPKHFESILEHIFDVRDSSIGVYDIVVFALIGVNTVFIIVLIGIEVIIYKIKRWLTK